MAELLNLALALARWLWPVGCGYGETSGFQELIVRAQSQEAEIMKQKEFLERVQGTIASITRKHEVDIQKAVQNCRLKYEEQTHKLIHIARFVDFLEHRAFRHPFTSQEDELAKKLTKLRNVFQDRSELTQLPKRIEALAALAREMKAHQKANGHVGQSTGQVQLASGSDKLVSTLFSVLCLGTGLTLAATVGVILSSLGVAGYTWERSRLLQLKAASTFTTASSTLKSV